MKLAVMGGAGVRSPLLIAPTLSRAARIHLDDIYLMDTNPEKLELLGALCQHIARRLDSPVRIHFTTDAREALEGASYIITTIRVGEEQGRVLDERIALRRGVLGQETTGPGGFAMAMRSIPAILEYAELAEQVAPGAWIFNFTNPAGLVTQALRGQGFSRTIGICDSANLAQTEGARFLGLQPDDLRAEVFGLNHLSWARRLSREDTDLLPGLLADQRFWASTTQHMFDRELIHELGLFLNEYLFYFYYPEKALQSIQSDSMTRGEEVQALNRRLLDQLRLADPRRDPETALRMYAAYEHRRSSTYMHYANPNGISLEEADQVSEAQIDDITLDTGEGYAGVALRIIEALESGAPVYTALNIPNHGAIDAMQFDDVVEISAVIENGAVRPLPIGPIPEHAELLMRSVKRYERLAVDAILNRSRSGAVMALMAHPLVQSYSLAQALADDYLTAHAPFVGGWS